MKGKDSDNPLGKVCAKNSDYLSNAGIVGYGFVLDGRNIGCP
jgi:hypothetical protein